MMSTVFHTIRYLKPVQVCYRVRRRIPHSKPASMPVPVHRATNGHWQEQVFRKQSQVAPARFRFLNEEREITGWNDPSATRLWLYNLHYFAYPSPNLVDRWISENPPGHGVGWDPYPLSLRVVNWIKWGLAGHELSPRILQSLATQTRHLASRIEYHLLGNHLIANMKALVFAGSWFAGGEAQRWLDQGLEGLGCEIAEQILADGGHFERSPMYHSVITEDLLDLVNLGHAYPSLLPDWSRVTARMLGWLDRMTHPDGGISFFNDAAFGVAAAPDQLRQYAGRLGIDKDGCAALSDSGYVRLETGDTVVLFDAAPIGPDYQPGHAHADTLSFELSHRGRRVLVNSGTSTYEPGPLRQWQRGTAAHNTLRVDRVDQSEVWKAFRVARRARLLGVRTDHIGFAEASHDGYRRLTDPVIHRRRVELDNSEVVITDCLEGRGRHTAEIFFHLHPEATVDIHLDPKVIRGIEYTSFYPEFNIAVPNKTIVGTWTGECPVEFRTVIRLQ
jgi:uncharacterized heparinase superfamily protein